MQDDIDTSVWSPDVQAYTRMFYARYGRGDPGKTPWRLGRGLNPLTSGSFKSLAPNAGQPDTDTFMTKAHMDIQVGFLRTVLNCDVRTAQIKTMLLCHHRQSSGLLQPVLRVTSRSAHTHASSGSIYNGCALMGQANPP
jgi:hypothetical protein